MFVQLTTGNLNFHFFEIKLFIIFLFNFYLTIKLHLFR